MAGIGPGYHYALSVVSRFLFSPWLLPSLFYSFLRRARFARNEEGAPINVRTDTSWTRVWERAKDVLTVADVIEVR